MIKGQLYLLEERIAEAMRRTITAEGFRFKDLFDAFKVQVSSSRLGFSLRGGVKSTISFIESKRMQTTGVRVIYRRDIYTKGGLEERRFEVLLYLRDDGSAALTATLKKPQPDGSYLDADQSSFIQAMYAEATFEFDPKIDPNLQLQVVASGVLGTITNLGIQYPEHHFRNGHHEKVLKALRDDAIEIATATLRGDGRHRVAEALEVMFTNVSLGDVLHKTKILTGQDHEDPDMEPMDARDLPMASDDGEEE